MRAGLTPQSPAIIGNVGLRAEAGMSVAQRGSPPTLGEVGSRSNRRGERKCSSVLLEARITLRPASIENIACIDAAEAEAVRDGVLNGHAPGSAGIEIDPLRRCVGINQIEGRRRDSVV